MNEGHRAHSAIHPSFNGSKPNRLLALTFFCLFSSFHIVDVSGKARATSYFAIKMKM
jgi:hypothetical protein